MCFTFVKVLMPEAAPRRGRAETKGVCAGNPRAQMVHWRAVTLAGGGAGG